MQSGKGYISAVTHLPTSTLRAILLVLVSGSAAVAPEAAHTLAHRRAAVVAEPDHHHTAPAGISLLDRGDASADHDHADWQALTPPTRSSLFLVVMARDSSDLAVEAPQARRIAVAIAHGLAPPEQSQAPPPPSRAPPLA